MNIQLRLTNEIKASLVEEMSLSGKAMNYLHRKGIFTINDLVDNLNNIGQEKGIGEGTINLIKNGMINLMIRKLPDEELIAWFDYLVSNNSAESLMSVVEGFAKIEETKAIA